MSNIQPGILATETKLARYLVFSMDSLPDVPAALRDLVDFIDPQDTVIGIGQSLVTALDKNISGLRAMPAHTANGIDIPSTPAALWCWLRGDDRGEIYHRSRVITDILSLGFELDDVIDSFSFDRNRDLGGYEDGTENPQGDAAIAAATIQGQGDGLDGSSFVAVQQWLHNFDTWEQFSAAERDDVFGRHVADNEEFDEAPESAHVKRTAQESFSPEAFVVRRSMPWADGMSAGLIFVAFGHSLAAFETILNRMIGNEDGITDGLFSFTRPITGAYFWCPPVKQGRLDLSILGM